MDLIPALPAVVGVAAYERRVRTLRARDRAVPPRAFVWVGSALVVAGLLLPDRPFAVHMCQHLLIGDVGPLFVVLGLSGPILRPLLAAPAIGRLRALAHPLVALPLWSAAFVVWHLSGPYDATLRNGTLHAAEHFSFFFAGALMWSAVFEPLPGPAWFGTGAKAAYVLVLRAVGSAIALALAWGPSSKHTGGLIMFFEGGVITLLVFAWLFLRWQDEAERRQRLIDRGTEPTLARRTARHWPRLRQPAGGARSAPSPAVRDRPSE